MEIQAILLVVLTAALVQVQCSGTCSGQYPVIPGPRGRDGIQGHSGPKGDKGDRGEAGRDGRDGIQGVPGAPGQDGIQGSSGLKGDKGDQGDAGRDGRDGIQGVPGAPGQDGIQGPSGLKGDKGDRGDVGRDGHDGIQGVPGGIGAKGDRGDPGGPPGEKGSVGPVGPKGDRGTVGEQGVKGEKGSNGPQGIQGPKGETGPQGSTTLKTTEYNEIVNTIMSSVDGRLDNFVLQNFFTSSENSLAKCGIPSANWRRIGYFDTTKGDPCPSGFRIFTNQLENGQTQTACGRPSENPNQGPNCTSLKFSPGGNYSHVCGRARGYQYIVSFGFSSYINSGRKTLNSSYLDGISFTQSDSTGPRNHLWSYVVGYSENWSNTYNHYSNGTITYLYPDPMCPCTRSDYPSSYIPSFIGDNFYCESGYVGKPSDNLGYTRSQPTWEDPLWDGSGCRVAGNQCCKRYGWFHREVPPSSDDIEVRWCSSNDHLSMPTDQLEIWVM